jgi:hypothetical protein
MQIGKRLKELDMLDDILLKSIDDLLKPYSVQNIEEILLDLTKNEVITKIIKAFNSI